MEIKTKGYKWDLIKLKSFCTAKETIKKVKRQPSEWKKIIASETTDKGLISKTCKQLIQLNTLKKKKKSKSGKKDLNRHFSKKTYRWLTNTLLEKCRSKLQWDITSHQSEWPSSKSTNNKFWKGCGEKGMLLHFWCECKLIQPLWKMAGRFLKKLGIKPPYDSAIPLLGIYPEEIKIEKAHVSHCSLQHYLQ